MDYINLRAFLALVEAGSLSAASEASGVPRATLARRVEALEAAVGVQLFDAYRGGKRPSAAGMMLRERGAALVARYDNAIAAARDPRSAAQGLRLGVDGRISELLAPLILPAVQRQAGEVEVSCQISDRPLDALGAGEVDGAAVLVSEDDPLAFAGQRIGEQALGLLASSGYLAGRDAPDDTATLKEHQLIAVADERSWPLAAGSTLEIAPAMRVSSASIARELVAADCGIALLPLLEDDAHPKMVRVLPSQVGAVLRVQLHLGDGSAP